MGTKQGHTDAIGLLEAAYNLEGDADEWLKELAHRAGALDDGLGVLAYRLAGNIRNIDAFASTNPETYTREVLLAATDALPERDHKAFFPTRVVSTLRERLDQPLEQHPLYETWFKPAGMQDALGIVAADGTDALVVLSVPLRRPMVLTARDRARFDRIAIHIAAANRLRARVRQEGLEKLDAILSPGGKVLEASGDAATAEARAELRDRARAIDRARTALRRRDEQEALALWQGLVVGRWSLCDHFDTDGHRFIIVRENDPNVLGLPGLTRREAQLLELYGLGHSQKLIAYELGLTMSVVSRGLRRVARLLGAANLAELSTIASRLSEMRAKGSGP